MSRFTAIIIGSGFGGISSAIQLQKSGIEDFRILERRPFMGGTWQQNTYPGAAVDVQSPLYSLSEEPYPWSRLFAEQEELESYTQYIINKHQLTKKTDLNTNVEKVIWQEDKSLWQIQTKHQVYYARFVLSASGPLSTAVIPSFNGQKQFKGTAFHTSQWDHRFDYSNKKVAIIGSGASAIQVVPAIAPQVQQLYIFQRNPHWIIPRPDYQFKAWQIKLFKLSWFYQILRTLIYWSLEFRLIGLKYSPFLLNLLAKRPALKHLKKQVQDLTLRKRLTPHYTIGCKRVLLSNTFYPALQRANVQLLTKKQGIRSMHPTGIDTIDGQKIDLDLIIYATGFDATDGIISYPVIGKGGQKLSQAWSEYPRAYLGTTVPGFPNFFILTGPNTGIGHTSTIFVIESQLKYILPCILYTLKNDHLSIEVTEEAEQAYTEMIHSEMERTVWHRGGCQSWYKSKSGKVTALFPGFTFTYRRMARRFNYEDHLFS